MGTVTLSEANRRPEGRRGLSAFDRLAIVGGTINLLVVATIVGWWLFG